MRTALVRVVLPTVLLTGVTAVAVHLGVRQVVRRELAAESGVEERAAVEAVLDELDLRTARIGGAVACMAVAVALGVGLRRSRPIASSHDASADSTLDELEQMKRRLARTERIAARREVARQVAHEIKNPLAPIQASMETLRRLRARNAPEFDDYFDEATRTVLAEVRRIASIVSEFSKFARMPSPRFERTDLGRLLRSLGTLHADPASDGSRGVSLDVAKVPAILADADQLTQVFTNLIQNGIEAARDSNSVPHVVLSLHRSGDHDVRVLVRDNGPGVEPSIRDRLFEPYVTTKHDGTGLGLAIVQTIVHEHGGEVRLLDDTGTGAAFEVLLPIDGPSPLPKAPAITVDPDAP